MKRGLRDAVLCLNQNYPLTLVPDDIVKAAHLDIMTHTLSHSLRRAARDGKVEVIYQKDNSGQDIAYYRGVPGYKPHKQAKVEQGPFFYSLPDIKGVSPYFDNINDLLACLQANRLIAVHIWTGTIEAPILVEL